MSMDNNDRKVIRGIDAYSKIIADAPKSLSILYRRTHPNQQEKSPSGLKNRKQESRNGTKSVALALTAGAITLNSIFSCGYAIGDEYYKNLKENEKKDKEAIESMEEKAPKSFFEYKGDTFDINEKGAIVPLDSREKNEECPIVFWQNNTDLYIEFNGISEVINANEAQQKYKDNIIIKNKIDKALESHKSPVENEWDFNLDNDESNINIDDFNTTKMDAGYDESNYIKAPETTKSDTKVFLGNDESENKTILQIYNNVNEIDIEQIKAEIDAKIDLIIDELQLQRSDNPLVQLRNCCFVQKYIVEHNHYNNGIMDEKSSYPYEYMNILDLYNAVVLGESVCTSNATMFKAILGRVGINSEVVCLTSTYDNGSHAANIVEINGEWSFFDSTLESSIYENFKEKYGSNCDFILCCAGLGSTNYSQYYTPLFILPDDLKSAVVPLPENIRKSDIPVDTIDKVMSPEFDSTQRIQKSSIVIPYAK